MYTSHYKPIDKHSPHTHTTHKHTSYKYTGYTGTRADADLFTCLESTFLTTVF